MMTPFEVEMNRATLIARMARTSLDVALRLGYAPSGMCARQVVCPRCNLGGDEPGLLSAEWRAPIVAKRPGCWACGGTGFMRCQSGFVGHDSPHGLRPELPGTPCRSCDRPISEADEMCASCWTSLTGMGTADVKAVFARGGMNVNPDGRSPDV